MIKIISATSLVAIAIFLGLLVKGSYREPAPMVLGERDAGFLSGSDSGGRLFSKKWVVTCFDGQGGEKLVGVAVRRVVVTQGALILDGSKAVIGNCIAQ